MHWSCEPTTRPATSWCFVAVARNENFALRLASTFDGIALADALIPIDAEHLVLLSDGADLDALSARVTHVRARRKIAIGLGFDAGLLAVALPDYEVFEASGEESLSLWRSLRTLMLELSSDEPPEGEDERAILPRAFLSHAVADEAELVGVVDFLRKHYGAQIFVCSDSIRQGTRWQASILEQLETCEVVLMMVSEASRSSTFCAFEVGYALALGKPLFLLSLDGSSPPAHIQHLHMHDLPRRMRARPWLSRQEALLELTLELLIPSA